MLIYEIAIIAGLIAVNSLFAGYEIALASVNIGRIENGRVHLAFKTKYGFGLYFQAVVKIVE